MHVTKNVFDSIIGTLLDMLRKMKDGLKSCNDLVQFGLRLELHPKLRPNGKHYLPPASYSLTIEEKKIILSVPAWGASTHRFLVQHQQTSLSERLVYVRLQFSQLSYDDDSFSRNCNKGHQTDAYQSTYHMLVLPFNTVSQKVIGCKELDDLKAYMIETMCMLEMCFRPFFICKNT
jgi:hypothetical protein